ncbi:Uncharacterised protein [uncultured archaeon]|nr:Uncharacterised protein [uncultured archaeon]
MTYKYRPGNIDHRVSKTIRRASFLTDGEKKLISGKLGEHGQKGWLIVHSARNYPLYDQRNSGTYEKGKCILRKIGQGLPAGQKIYICYDMHELCLIRNVFDDKSPCLLSHLGKMSNIHIDHHEGSFDFLFDRNVHNAGAIEAFGKFLLDFPGFVVAGFSNRGKFDGNTLFNVKKAIDRLARYVHGGKTAEIDPELSFLFSHPEENQARFGGNGNWRK